MSSAGSESPHSNQPSPNPPPDEVTLEKLCKKGATVTRASELLDELTSKFSEFRRGTHPSHGTTALCAFIASEQCVSPSQSDQRRPMTIFPIFIIQARE